jgi:hypothetical protein
MESNFPVARFLDMPRRIAQERVPTASNVGSRDVTWASQPHPSSPSRLFSSFAGQLRKEEGKLARRPRRRRIGVWACGRLVLR